MTNSNLVKKLILLGGDTILVVISFYLSPTIRFGTFLDLKTVFGGPDITSIMSYLLLFYIFDTYSLEENFRGSEFAIHFAIPVVIGDIFIASIFFIFRIPLYSGAIFLLNSIMIYSFCLGWRMAFKRIIEGTQQPLRLAVLGAGMTGRAFSKLMMERNGYRIVGFIDDNAVKYGEILDGIPILGGSDLITSLVQEKKIDKVIVAITGGLKPEVYKRLIEAKFSGVNVYEMPTFCEMITRKVPVSHINDIWLIQTPISGMRDNLYNNRMKRIIDILMSLIVMIVSLPLMVLIWLAIRLDSPGPALFIQQRVGWKGQTFDLIKFRSMKTDAEMNGAVWAKKNDSRTTRVGRIIRIFRIDELPQLWNVLNGDMSFIGPRPERPDFIEELTTAIPYYSLRHSLKPGITGWAQVNYPYGSSQEDALEKLQYDLYYLKNLSFLLDLHILLRTVRVVLFGRGAR